jgi:CDP-glucose 4,6-dehydratase
MDFSALQAAYAGKRVLVTGHTGFKGAWLCEWLLALGAAVHGVALAPEERSLFGALGLEARVDHRILDVRDAAALREHVGALRPEFVFHLAAQPLVRLSYREPVATFDTNVMGVTHLLDAVRSTDFSCAVVVVTSDKCYSNDGRPRAFLEDDPLGGHDPYSASKAAAEIVTAAYRDSFFAHDPRVALASARAGNVIGGGDWAAYRIVPDAVRALEAGRPIPVRNPSFTRPWQHVLEPLGGYLLLGAKLDGVRRAGDAQALKKFTTSFNFGPGPAANRTVRELADEILRHWPGKWKQGTQEKHLPEAPLLSLDIGRANAVLGWQPRWNFAETVTETIAWYRAIHEKKDAVAQTQAQIATYSRSSCSGGL